MFETSELCRKCLLGQTTCERYYHEKITECADFQEGFDLDDPLNSTKVEGFAGPFLSSNISCQPTGLKEEVRDVDPYEILEETATDDDSEKTESEETGSEENNFEPSETPEFETPVMGFEENSFEQAETPETETPVLGFEENSFEQAETPETETPVLDFEENNFEQAETPETETPVLDFEENSFEQFETPEFGTPVISPEENNFEQSETPEEPTASNSEEQDDDESDRNDIAEDDSGFKINWIVIFIVAILIITHVQETDNFLKNYQINLIRISVLAVAVLLHELGHMFTGLYFKCKIKEVQLFFLSLFSYKITTDPAAPAWKRIRWSLGVLPFGGVTIFGTKDPETGRYGLLDLPMWQQFLISGAGVAVNVLLFAILYLCIAYLPLGPQILMVADMLARLSLILAVLNIIPVYPLDGGAMLFQIIQMVTGKKLSPKFMSTCSWVGFILIIIFFFVFNDWVNVIYSWIDMIL